MLKLAEDDSEVLHFLYLCGVSFYFSRNKPVLQIVQFILMADGFLFLLVMIAVSSGNMTSFVPAIS